MPATTKDVSELLVAAKDCPEIAYAVFRVFLKSMSQIELMGLAILRDRGVKGLTSIELCKEAVTQPNHAAHVLGSLVEYGMAIRHSEKFGKAYRSTRFRWFITEEATKYIDEYRRSDARLQSSTQEVKAQA